MIPEETRADSAPNSPLGEENPLKRPEEYIGAPAEHLSPEEFSQEEEFLPQAEFVRTQEFHVPEDTPGVDTVDAKLTFRRFLTIVIALLATASIIHGSTEHAETPEASLPPVLQAVEAIVYTPTPSPVSPTPSPSPVPAAPDPLAGFSDAELLVDGSVWQGDGIEVSFLPGGTGYWKGQSSVGLMSWSEQEDGRVSYTGTAILFNSGDSSAPGEASEDAVYYTSTVTCSGTVDLNRNPLQASLTNPLQLPSQRYSPSGRTPSPETSGLLETVFHTPEALFRDKTWHALDNRDTGIASLSFTDGEGTVTVNGNQIAVTVSPSESEAGQYLLTTGDDGFHVQLSRSSDVTVSGGIRIRPAVRNDRIVLLIMDLLDEGSFAMREYVMAE